MLPVGEIICGDCLDIMRGWPDGCVDCCICDPPYGLSFMGKKWDYDVPSVEIWREVYRVLKDGGRLLAFSGARTQHRMVCNIEDAGFCIEDCMMWLYGSGFPKHKSKLKPAYEPICVARKGKVSLLNINAARIGTAEDTARPVGVSAYQRHNSVVTNGATGGRELQCEVSGGNPAGRWPANVLLDEEAARQLDEMSGTRSAGHFPLSNPSGGSFWQADYKCKLAAESNNGHGDSGGASRFFYTAKASASERNAGCEGLPERESPGGHASEKCANCGRQRINTSGACECAEPAYKQYTVKARNHHPTVKPLALMRYLCKLAVQPGSIILDPFTGSGTTCIAAALEGMQYIGIEREAEYVDIARARLKHWTAQKGLDFMQDGDTAQSGAERGGKWLFLATDVV